MPRFYKFSCNRNDLLENEATKLRPKIRFMMPKPFPLFSMGACALRIQHFVVPPHRLVDIYPLQPLTSKPRLTRSQSTVQEHRPRLPSFQSTGPPNLGFNSDEEYIFTELKFAPTKIQYHPKLYFPAVELRRELGFCLATRQSGGGLHGTPPHCARPN